jgi:hypothetical protein
MKLRMTGSLHSDYLDAFHKTFHKQRPSLLKLWKGFAEWSVIFVILGGFTWLQIQVLQYMRPLVANILLIILVSVELLLLLLVNWLFG